ncbi:hypothetical protein BDN67DRAFT_388278 [Paxillus ammoniavirescens]|nr:hypothetical protein BDN67DRAFT_388278 [Paxillus ammoniavirescens]
MKLTAPYIPAQSNSSVTHHSFYLVHAGLFWYGALNVFRRSDDSERALDSVPRPLLLQLTQHSAIAALTVIIWEALITFGDEVTYVWSKPRWAHVKWLYLFGKYFGILSQIANFAFIVGFRENMPMPLAWCRGYHTTQVVCIALLMLAFDIVLLLRVYALYERNIFVIALGAFTVLVESMLTVACAVVAIPASDYDFACLVLDILPEGIVFFMVGTCLSQTILLGLAYRKKNVARGHQERPSVACITIRDGACAFAVLIALLLMFL